MEGRASYIALGPYTRLGHGTNEVRTGEEDHAYATLLARRGPYATDLVVDLVLEVVEDDGGALVGLEGFPGVDHEPLGGLVGGEGAHVYAGEGEGMSARGSGVRSWE